MTQEEFNKLIAQCQPHKIFKTDWKTYYSIDFANTMLPDVNGFEGKAMLMYDGVDLFKSLKKTEQKLLKLTKGIELISLVSYTYPKGVLAEIRKENVVVDDHEICTFIETSQDDKLDIFFKFGKKYKQFLSDYFVENKITGNPDDIDRKIYKTSVSDFKKHFNDTIVHYNMMSFIGKTTSINLVAVNDKVAYKLKIDRIKIKTSEPSDNQNRKKKETKQQYLIIDFTIFNYPSTDYKLTIYKNKEKIEEHIFLPEVVVVAKKNLQDKNNNVDPTLHKSGKHQIVFDCTKSNILNAGNEKDKITIRLEATNENKEKAYDQKEMTLQNLIKEVEIDNYIFIVDPNKTENDKDCYIKILGSQIIERQKKFKNKIPQKTYDKLTDEGKLIINLPVIMTKLGFLHGALCQIHWLEGSTDSLKFPYDFFMSGKRVENIDVKNLTWYFKNIRYISASDENLEPIEPDGKNIFLYNETVPSVVDALKDFKKLISKLTKSTDVGDYENMNNHIGEKGIKYNYFQSFSLGNAIGDFDDLGTAIGKYSQRCYFKGNIYKKSESDKWLLNVDEIACRFVDSFGFNENYLLGLRSQDLGCWINDINKPSIPNRVKYPWESKKICLQNLDYQNLKEILAGNKEKKKPAIIVNSCNDFLIYSDYKIFKNGVVKKRDIVF